MKFARMKLCIECDEIFEEESQCPSCMCSSFIFPAKILQINKAAIETAIDEKFYDNLKSILKKEKYNEEFKKKWNERCTKPWNINSIIEESKS